MAPFTAEHEVDLALRWLLQAGLHSLVGVQRFAADREPPDVVEVITAVGRAGLGDAVADGVYDGQLTHNADCPDSRAATHQRPQDLLSLVACDVAPQEDDVRGDERDEDVDRGDPE